MGTEKERPNTRAVAAVVKKFEDLEKDGHPVRSGPPGHALIGRLLAEVARLSQIAEKVQKDLGEGREPKVKVSVHVFRDLEPVSPGPTVRQHGPTVTEITILEYHNTSILR